MPGRTLSFICALNADGFVEAQHGEIRFPDVRLLAHARCGGQRADSPAYVSQITTAVLEKVCQYFYHKLRCDDVVKRGSEAPLQEFHIAPEIVLQLLMVCVWLDRSYPASLFVALLNACDHIQS